MRAGQEGGAEGSGGPFPPQNAPSRVWLTPPSQHLPAYPWLALSVRGAAGMGAQGRGRAEPGCAGCAAEGSGRSSPSAGLRSPRAGRGAGMSPPACAARGARHGPARHGTARGTAERSSAAPRPPGTAPASRAGLGAPAATPEAGGASLLLLFPPGLLLKSFAVQVSDTTPFP